MIWVELVCDQCATTLMGSDLANFSKRKTYEHARNLGWSVTARRQVCGLCIHHNVTGHIIDVTYRTCCVPNCNFSDR